MLDKVFNIHLIGFTPLKLITFSKPPSENNKQLIHSNKIWCDSVVERTRHLSNTVPGVIFTQWKHRIQYFHHSVRLLEPLASVNMALERRKTSDPVQKPLWPCICSSEWGRLICNGARLSGDNPVITAPLQRAQLRWLCLSVIQYPHCIFTA